MFEDMPFNVYYAFESVVKKFVKKIGNIEVPSRVYEPEDIVEKFIADKMVETGDAVLVRYGKRAKRYGAMFTDINHDDGVKVIKFITTIPLNETNIEEATWRVRSGSKKYSDIMVQRVANYCRDHNINLFEFKMIGKKLFGDKFCY